MITRSNRRPAGASSRAWIALVAALLSMPAAAACDAVDLASLASCAVSTGDNGQINLTADIECDGIACCPGGQTPLRIHARSNLIVDGRNHRIVRTADASAHCSIAHVSGSSGIQLRNLIVEENPQIRPAPCYQGSSCPSRISLWIQGSSNVTMDRIEVFDAPSYAVVASGVNGLRFERSKIHNAGLAGLFAGPDGALGSSGVVVDNSLFTATATNAVTFYGSSDNRLSNSLLLGNHRHGVYYWCGPGADKACNGGQVYLPHANQVVIEDNIIGDGRCDNCVNYPGHTYNQAVWPIEAGGYSGLSDPAQVVQGLQIRRNYVYNHAQATVLRNENSILNGFYLSDNVLAGAGALYMQVNANDRCASTTGNVVDRDKCGSDANQPHLSNNQVSSPYQLDRAGAADWTLYQLMADGFHYEARYPQEQPQLVAAHKLGLRPLAGVDGGGAIYRCWINGPIAGGYRDFVTTDRKCEGGGTLDSVVGFSVGAGSPGAYPIYRCRNGYDHYVSTQSSCDGTANEGLLGYAMP